ncbi:metallophosphoesterase family protein [Pseudomonas sp. KNUC1026]|uniref:metallophosphoesterase family protein n=1 Tax=Pseudomonas sp. KNUC1026 TaxID=2893890 RepID=UPI001F30DEEF|nr:metallophosphoesterase family protein [Pseudomonas sp. KNUC1026]UFH50060.1 metallophosphatase family protein [Pseudomonas sp. KNUC1026]
MKVGVISDTHGLLRPQAVEALEGSDWILHAGDIGSPDIIEQLAAIAPVTAVRGNNDQHAPWASSIGDVVHQDLNGWHILLVHDIADADPALKAETRIVITGHSHKPRIEWRDGRLYLNPGSAGPRRFKLPVTVAHLWLEGHQPRAELTPLLDPPG